MNSDAQHYALAAWKLPLIVAAIACSIVLGFWLGGPGLGMAVGALAASSIIVMAIRNPPKPAIAPPAAADGRNRLLLLVDEAIGAAAVTAATIAAVEGGGGIEVLAVVPLRQRLLDRWACDTDRDRKLAEGRLATVLSSLRRAGVRASGRLGDENPVQAVEDALRSYPATRVAMLAPEASAAAGELQARLTVPFAHLRDEAGAPRAEAPSRARRGRASRGPSRSRR